MFSSPQRHFTVCYRLTGTFYKCLQNYIKNTLYRHVDLKEIMPNWPLYNSASTKVTLRDRAVDANHRRVSPAVPFSVRKRGLDLEELARGIGLSHPTMTRLVPADSSRRGDSVNTNFFQIERFKKK